MSKLLIINGSYREEGNTYRALMAESNRIVDKYGIEDDTYYFLPEMVACQNCGGCQKTAKCVIKDDLNGVLSIVERSDRILIGSPVYLDFPSPKLLAFLSRCICKAEPTQREFFRGKKVHLLATAYCSGTKTVIHSLMGACEMLGFDIEGRSSKEYVTLWKDLKIRGGMTPQDSAFMPEQK